MRYFQQVQAARRLVVSLCRYAVAFVTLFSACGLLWAQTGGTGAISGAVTDPTGALVVGAQVKATEVSTGYTRIMHTNDNGMYVIPLLPTGQYTLEVTKQGFKVATSPDVQVIVAETTVLNVKLQTGTVTQTVTVATSAVELETQSSEMGRVTNSQMVENLPLVTRNFTQIIALNPGVAQSLNNAGALGRGEGSQQGEAAGGAIMSQGATSEDNNFEINGLPVNDMQSSGLYSSGIPIPNPDTIQEFKVQTAQYDATTGRNAGADVDVITKGGTNEYHATLFEYFRNEDLNANDWFAKKGGQPRPVLRQNQYGLTAAGPLIRNKVLLFGSWQGTKQLNALDPTCHHNDLLPPLTDDRSYAGLGKVFGGDQGFLGVYGGTVAADGSNITPQALALFNVKLPDGQYMIPTPAPKNIDASKPLEIQGSAFLSEPGTFNENQWMVNGDYLRSDRDKIAVRYFGATSLQESTVLYSTYGNPLFLPERFDVGSISDTYTLSPRAVNQFTAGMHRSYFDMYYKNAFTFSSIGMTVPAEEDAYPNIDIAFDGFQTGTTSATTFLEDEYNITDTLSWIKGKHQFTFGGGFSYGRDDMSKFFFEGYVIPLTWADFLLGQSNLTYYGYPLGYSNIYESLQGLGNFARDYRYKQGQGFIQDDYVVTQHFTLNLGLRYEHLGDLGMAEGRGGNTVLSAINPNPGPEGSLDGYLVASNYNGPTPIPAGVIKGSNTFGYNGDGQDVWNPRVGFAWMLPGSDRFLLRGGVGMYHTTVEGQMNLQLCASSPFGQWSFNEGTYNVDASDAHPFGFPPAFPAYIPYSDSTAATMAAFDMGFRPPTTYHYSLGLQSKLPGGPILDVSFAGARNLHLIMGDVMNQAPLASPSNPIRGVTTNTVANIGLRKPYIGWSTNTMWQWRTGNQAWYNALEASLSQQYKHRFQYQASFTWARLLSPVPDFSNGTNSTGPTGDENNLRAGYGPDQNIRPLRFVLSGLYNLPGPTNNHLLADAFGGWAVATATVIQDGQQLPLGYTNNNNVYGETLDRPSFAPGCTAKDLEIPGSVGNRVNGYINGACLAAPAIIGDDGIGRGFGNTPNGVLRGPDQTDVDLMLSKSLRAPWPKEGANVKLRADFFNALNHPSFANPDTAYGTAALGYITAMSTNPRVIQFALRYSF
jgi:Carboxypeptidase regulatory-like domain